MEKTEQSCQKQISDGKKRKMASDSSDRLSALPDCVLTHILSFLSTKLSVRTSILGRRWRFLWSQVPILDFHRYDYDDSGTAMSKIINKVMMLHKVTNLDTFRLFLEDCCNFEFEAWIATLSDRNVRTLFLDVFQVNEIKVPLCLFNCKTLVDLTLIGCCVCMDIPRTGPVCLPALKKLHLSGVTFTNVPLYLFNCKTLVDLTLIGFLVCMDIPRTGPVCLPALKKLHLSGVTFAAESTFESLPHLLSGCPVLEELLVEVDAPENTVVICHITSPTLINLVLISEGCAVFKVKLDTPALRYLKLRGTMSGVSAGVLPSLVEADISFGNCELFKRNIFYCPVIEFLGKLCNVKCLKLRIGQLNVSISSLTIKFYNLTKLELAADAYFIRRFLKNADNLQVMVIHKVYGHHFWTDPKQVPACLASHLRTVKIHSVECTQQELSMMRYILRNAKVLEMMGICSSNGIDKLRTLKRISTFQRGSETCQVVFS